MAAVLPPYGRYHRQADRAWVAGMRTNHVLFVIMAVIWGVTWIAIKAGIMAVPPVFFAAARFTLVGATLVVSIKGVLGVFAGGRVGRVIATGLLVNVGT